MGKTAFALVCLFSLLVVTENSPAARQAIRRKGVNQDAWANADSFTLLHSFDGTDGEGPYAGLASDGTWFYGTTPLGGEYGNGTIFAIDSAGDFKILYSFSGGSDGAKPNGGVIEIGGYLYGTTTFGGANGQGSVFSVSTAGGIPTTIHSFFAGGGADGAEPFAGLLQAGDGYLYGTTYLGGTGGQGIVFKISTDGSVYNVLYNFTGVNGDGANPRAGLIQGRDEYLYGTTLAGGTGSCYQGCGIVFKMDTSGNLAFEYSLNGSSDGANPFAGLVQASDGNFYGTANGGGNGGDGTIFKVDSSGAFSVFYTFNITNDGGQPYAGLIQGSSGDLYGVTPGGGSNSKGTIFSIDLSGNFTVIQAFGTTSPPYCSGAAGTLFETPGNSLYGTTQIGGANNDGCVFQFALGSHKPPKVTGIKNTITADDLTVTNNMACPSGTSGSSCFSIQQNFYISTTNSNIPSYWAQNVLGVRQIPSGGWQVAHEYEVWTVNQQGGIVTLIACNGTPINNVCYGSLTWKTWSKTSNLVGSPSLHLAATMSQTYSLTFAASIGKNALKTFSCSPSDCDATGSSIMAAATDQQAQSWPYQWEPQLMLVGFNSGSQANFCSSNDCNALGTLNALFQFARRSWKPPGTQYANENCSSTQESSVGLYWYVPATGAATFTTTNQSGYSLAEGIIFVPALNAGVLAGCQ